MPRVFSRWSDRPGMRRLRFVSQPRQIFPGHENEDRASRVVGSRCQEIYLRRRQHVLGRPRPAANNSLIYLYSPLKLAARHLLGATSSRRSSPSSGFRKYRSGYMSVMSRFAFLTLLKDAPSDAITWDSSGFRALISYINARNFRRAQRAFPTMRFYFYDSAFREKREQLRSLMGSLMLLTPSRISREQKDPLCCSVTSHDD